MSIDMEKKEQQAREKLKSKIQVQACWWKIINSNPEPTFIQCIV